MIVFDFDILGDWDVPVGKIERDRLTFFTMDTGSPVLRFSSSIHFLGSERT